MTQPCPALALRPCPSGASRLRRARAPGQGGAWAPSTPRGKEAFGRLSAPRQYRQALRPAC
jgi:hypothetical protein